MLKNSRTQLELLDRFGKKSADTLINSIGSSSKVDLYRLIYSLGIEEVGETTARNLATHFKDFKLLSTATFEELVMIQDIGPRVASKIIDYFSDAANQKVLDALLPHLDLISPRIIDADDGNLMGLQIAITGKLSLMSRDELKEKLLQQGAKVTSSISSNTSYLIAGENTESKLAKAKELNVRILSENDINTFLNDPQKSF